MIYFTADLHLDHFKILELMKRPFVDLDHMNEQIVLRHNEVVKPNDDVWYLGDIAFKNTETWLKRLNGRKHLVLGNHDDKRIKGAVKDYFESIQDVKYLRYNGERFYLSHYAHRTWRNSHHGSYHLYGHSHGMLDPDWGRSMDVGVDANGFYPISIDEVIEKLKDKGPVDHHPEEEEESRFPGYEDGIIW